MQCSAVLRQPQCDLPHTLSFDLPFRNRFGVAFADGWWPIICWRKSEVAPVFNRTVTLRDSWAKVKGT